MQHRCSAGGTSHLQLCRAGYFHCRCLKGQKTLTWQRNSFKAQRNRMAKRFVIKMTCFGSKAERNTFKNRSSWAQHGAATSAGMNFPDVCPQFTHSSSRAMLFPRQGRTHSSPAKRGGSSWDAEGKPWGHCAVWRTNTLCKLILH